MVNSTEEVWPTWPSEQLFTERQTSEICAVSPHVLRYWGEALGPLRPSRVQGRRRYYQRQEILLIQQVRKLMEEQRAQLIVPPASGLSEQQRVEIQTLISELEWLSEHLR